MNVGAAAVADTEATELVQPGEGALHHPAIDSQATAMLAASAAQDRVDASTAQPAAPSSDGSDSAAPYVLTQH